MSSKLFVGNLAQSVTEGALTDLATRAGITVASVLVIRDKATGESKGFGFVELAEGANLEEAVRGMAGKMLDGRPLAVNQARPSRTDSPAIAGRTRTR